MPIKQNLDQENLIIEKIIKKVYTLLNLNKEELLFERKVTFRNEKDYIIRADVIGYLTKDLKNPFILIESKIGRINLNLCIDHITNLVKNSKATYAILSNGDDFYFFKNVNGKIVSINSLPKKGFIETIIKIKKNEFQNLIDVLNNTFFSHSKFERSLIIIKLFALMRFLHESKRVDEFRQIINTVRNMNVHGTSLKGIDQINSVLNDVLTDFLNSNPNFNYGYIFKELTLDLICGIEFISGFDFSELSDEEWGYLINEVNKEPSEWKTPPKISEFIGKIVNSIGTDDKIKIADLTCGSGGDLLQLISTLKNNTIRYNGYDQNQSIIEYCNYLFYALNYKKVNFEAVDTLTNHFTGLFDLILCSPPFGVRRPDMKNYTEFKTDLIEELFIIKSLKLLKNGGKLIIIVPQRFLSSDGPTKRIREYILKNHNLLSIIDFPSGIFLPLTSVNASILIIEKSTPTSRILMSYFQKDEASQKIITILSKFIKNQDFILNDKSHEVYITHKSKIKEDLDLRPILYNPKIEEDKEKISSKYEIKKLKDLVYIDSGISVASKKYSDTGTPYIRIKDIFDNEVYLDGAYSTKEEFDKKYLIQRGNILLSSTGTIGKLAVYRHDEPAICSNSLFILRPKENLDPDYLLNLIENRFVQIQITLISKGDIIKHISKKDLEDIEIPIIPLDNQKQKILEAERIRKELEILEQEKRKLELKLKKLTSLEYNV